MSAYLKKSIGAIVMTMALGHAAETFANNSTTNWLDTIHVTAYDNPYDVANSAFGWTIEDYNAWDAGFSEEYGGGGGGGEFTPPPIYSPCDDLRATQPLNCPNPIPMPNRYDHGRDLYPAGTAIPRLVYWIEYVGGVDATAREFARRSLTHHTIDITQSFVSRDVANERLLLSIQTACHLQHAADEQNPWIVAELSHMERRCLDILEQLQGEAGHPGFHDYLFQWMEREGIHLEDISIDGVSVPETLIDWLSPSNSLRIRYDAITADAKCAKWWIDAQANQCVF